MAKLFTRYVSSALTIHNYQLCFSTNKIRRITTKRSIVLRKGCLIACCIRNNENQIDQSFAANNTLTGILKFTELLTDIDGGELFTAICL